jgi:hypothetical protein
MSGTVRYPRAPSPNRADFDRGKHVLVAAGATSPSQPAWIPPPLSADLWSRLLSGRPEVSDGPVTTATALEEATDIGRTHD